MKNVQYEIQYNGQLSTVIGENALNVTWGKIYYSDMSGKLTSSQGTTYQVIVTKEPRAKLDSICALRKESKFVTASFETKEQFYHFEKPVPGERYYINVIAKTKLDS